MIHHVIAAPKHLPDDIGVKLALTCNLGYEIPAFIDPLILEEYAINTPVWRKKAENISGMLTLHGPVYDLNPVSQDPQIAKISKTRYEQAVLAGRDLGCRYVVIHTQYNSLVSVAGIYNEWMKASIDFWQQFASEVLEKTPSLLVVLENFMETEPQQLRTLIDGINHPQVKACLDIGHANIYSESSVINWLDELEHQLVYIHFHNNHGLKDEHRGYNHGTIDTESFLNHLVLLPYHINIALEIFNESELNDSCQLVQKYLANQTLQLPEKTFLI